MSRVRKGVTKNNVSNTFVSHKKQSTDTKQFCMAFIFVEI